MSILFRSKRFLKKIITGGHPIKIKYSQQNWNAQFEKGNWNFLLEEQENIVYVAHVLNQKANQTTGKLRVFDVGCGNGALAKLLDHDQIDYVGSDISDSAILEAKQYVPDGRFFQLNLDEIDSVPDNVGTFDVIVFCEVLIYVDYEKVISEYQQYLKQDGHFLISLYDVWRTKLIWRNLLPELNVSKHIFIKNKMRNIGWTIVLGSKR